MSSPQIPSASRDQVVEWLVNARFSEFAEVVREVLRTRMDSEYSEGRLLGLAIGERLEQGKWSVWVNATGDSGHYGGSSPDGEPWCQSGRCGSCGLDLVSELKWVRCPFCDSPAFLT